MIKDFVLEHSSALFSLALTILIVAIRIYFWQMEMRELRMHGQSNNSLPQKQKSSYKRTSYADVA